MFFLSYSEQILPFTITFNLSSANVFNLDWSKIVSLCKELMIFGLFSGDKDCNDDLLHAGSHYFPFEFTLPTKLPSSFKGKHGRLRYYVRLTICTPGGPHHERSSKFAVISNLDLNKEPDASVSLLEPLESLQAVLYFFQIMFLT